MSEFDEFVNGKSVDSLNTDSISEMNELVRTVREAELVKEGTKKANSEANAILVEAKEKLISALKEAGLTRWEGVDEFSGFTMSDQLKFRVPQGLEDNASFLSFLKSDKVAELLGQSSRDVYFSYAKVNAQALTPLLKKLKALAADSGEDIDFPGIMAPTFETTLRTIPKRRK